MRNLVLSFLALVLVTGFLSACSPSDPAIGAVEDYLNALVGKDAERLSTVSCADWEMNALMELDSLQAVDTRLEGLACTVSGSEADSTFVTCQGKIITTYNNENQEIDLSARSYVVIRQGGENLVCGYQ